MINIHHVLRIMAVDGGYSKVGEIKGAHILRTLIII
jgi:hypothetical protein